jgi:thiamine pyrophosphate-dependent acetolactate synthase large subunit-like protein
VADDAPLKPGRRGFLKGAALGGIAAAATPALAVAQTAPAAGAKPAAGSAARVDPNKARPAQPVSTAGEATNRDEGATYTTCGGDYMTDVLRSLGIEYFAATPGNTFMGLHEAIVNYGMLTQPKIRSLTTMHEEASVAMSHGYAKIAGKPMACMFHTTVGTMHASMAIYNAYADRVPIFMMTGAALQEERRPGGVDWLHDATDGPAMVRDYTKWDDTPASLTHFGESAVRAWKFAMTPPYGPVLLAVDTQMQEDEIPGGQAKTPAIPKLPRIVPPAGEAGAVRELAGMLVKAENPVICADRCARTTQGLKLLTELAETLQAPVCDTTNRMNFPWRHPLNMSSRQAVMLNQADLVLGLEPGDPFGLANRKDKEGNVQRLVKPNAKVVTISSVELYPKGNYQDLQRYPSNVDIAMEADAEATLPFLIEEVKRQMGAKNQFEARGQACEKAHLADLENNKRNAAFGWDDNPISMPRMCQELYEQIKGEDWSLVSDTNFQSRWPQKLWHADKHHQFIGGHGAAGIGYLTPASLGAALANQEHGRISVSFIGDGDLMFGPGVLWTAAHEQIPILYLVHNNRGYHMEIMQMQVIANRRNRGIDRLGIACGIDNPNINYAMMAKSMGMYAEGPIENPKDLGPAIKRALAVVKKGEPALIDVVSQGR